MQAECAADRSASPPPGRVGGPSALALIVAVLTIAAAAFAVGWPTRNGQFLRGDDQRFVTEHVLVRHPSFRNALALLATVHGDLYQPVPMLSFQLDCLRAEDAPAERFGMHARTFHMTNIALHTLNAILAASFVKRLTGRLALGWAVGLMFACHPLVMEPVAWISGRMVLLATSFALLMLLVCVGRQAGGRESRGWFALVPWGLSLLSKVMPTVPIAAAASEWHCRGRLSRDRWLRYGVLLGMAWAMTMLAIHTSSRFGMFEGTEAEATTGLPVRVLLAGAAYLQSYVWPARLGAWSPPPEGVTIQSVEAGTALLVWLGLAGLLAGAYRRERTVFIGLLLFLILLLPFLATTAARQTLIADRYMYLPMIGLHIAVAAGVAAVLRRAASVVSTRTAAMVGAVLLVAITTLWARVAWRQVDHWQDTIARDRRLVELYPDRVEAHVQLAQSWIWEGNASEALRVIALARAKWPDHPRLAAEAGEACRLQRDWAAALAELDAASAQLPGRVRTLYHRALTLEQIGRIDAARAEYKAILDRWPGFFPAATALARNYRSAGDLDSAKQAFAQALDLNPRHRDSLFELALLHMASGEWASAESLLRRITESDSADLPALVNLGAVVAHQGRTEEALAIYDRLLGADPTAVSPRLNRAALLASAGRIAESEADYRRVRAEHPTLIEAVIGLHELLEQAGRTAELVRLWTEFTPEPSGIDQQRAWLVWALTANDEQAQAKLAVSEIDADSPSRSFAEWALACAALKQREDTVLIGLLHDVRGHAISRPAAHRTTEAQLVLRKLADLPVEIRESPAGFLALALALVFKQDWPAAETAARQALAVISDEPWHAEAQDLLRVIRTAKDARPPTMQPCREGAAWQP